jgi:hypothetical protein
MPDGADDEEDETEDRRCPEGKGRAGGVAAAIDALYAYISISIYLAPPL